jgi:hypothetical protein
VWQKFGLHDEEKVPVDSSNFISRKERKAGAKAQRNSLICNGLNHIEG